MKDEISKKVPMLFRAQVQGRCQLQRLVKDEEPDALRWVKEWSDQSYPYPPHVPDADPFMQSRIYSLTWRFVTNGGQDDGVIRPVIGARGWPFYPGSSMKGLFRRACTTAQADRYCGRSLPGGDFEPGLLRFLGGYPTSTHWTENLVDIIHPQQDWQVKTDSKSKGAFCQISLYKPELRFCISTSDRDTDWEEVWQIWEKALSQGIGCRVSAGYGQTSKFTGTVLFRCKLQGKGQAPKLFDETGEFRPNMFRAAIRGHALRIFGGLTDAKTADRLVNELFGSTEPKTNVGLLGMNFHDTKLKISTFGRGSYEQPIYDVEGDLIWFLAQDLPTPDHEKKLRALVTGLTRFAVLLGGFGKSWRRADHRKFFPEYYDRNKPLIGCHWEWLGQFLVYDVVAGKPEKVGEFIDKVRQIAKDWMQLQNLIPQEKYAPWREAWHPENVEVWGRVAEDADDSESIRWFHEPYQKANRVDRTPESSIYQSSLTGEMKEIGRIWHRMYPQMIPINNPKDPTGKPIFKKTLRYLELLTIFPNDDPQTLDFLGFLDDGYNHGFQKLWPLDDP